MPPQARRFPGSRRSSRVGAPRWSGRVSILAGGPTLSLTLALAFVMIATASVAPSSPVGARSYPVLSRPSSTLVATSWHNVSSLLGPLPPARCCGAMAYDPPAFETVLFGGSGACGNCNNTYVLSGGKWSTVSNGASPSARSWASMTYDPALQQLVLFGGESSATGAALGDTWLFNGSSWTLLPTDPSSSPSPRWSAALSWDSEDGELVLFGGYSAATGFLGDTWVLQGENWSQIEPLTSPSPRWGAAFANDPAEQEVVLFGGYSPVSGFLGDTWGFAHGTWTAQPTRSGPPPREKAGFAFDPALGAPVLFGGDSCPVGCLASSSYHYLNDTWTFQDGRWSNDSTEPRSPPARCCATLSFDASRNAVVLFSGTGGTPSGLSQSLNDAWTYSSPSRELRPVGLWALPQTVAQGGELTLTVGVEGLLGVPVFQYPELPPGCKGANLSVLACSPTAQGTFPLLVVVSDTASGASVVLQGNVTVGPPTLGASFPPWGPWADLASPVGAAATLVLTVVLVVLIDRARRGLLSQTDRSASR